MAIAVLALFNESCATRLELPQNASWRPETSTFSWWEGQVKVPSGPRYQVDQGADSFEGHFTSTDGSIVIRHDIGGYAGAWAKHEKAASFREVVVNGSRVWIAKRDWPGGKGLGGRTTLMAVTFPDAGCANFFIASSNPRDFEFVEFVAASFRPTSPVAQSTSCR